MSIVSNPGDSDFSPTWKWRDDEELAGRHVEFRRASTALGEAVVWEIRTNERGPVSVWLEPAVLVRKVRDELARRRAERGEARLEPDELVRLNPGVKRASKRSAGQTLWPFPVVWFEHGVPEQTAEDFLLAGAGEPDDGGGELEAATAPPPLSPPGDGDGIPF